MAFELTNFNNVTSGQSSDFEAKIWAYASDTDTLETVSTAGYFNQMKHALAADNLIYISASDGRAIYYVTSALSADSVTIAELSESPSHSEFSDSNFRIYDNGDNTKKIAFEASSISTGTTRTLTMPDFDITLANMAAQSSSSVNIDGGTIDGVTIGASNKITSLTSFWGLFESDTDSGSFAPIRVTNNIDNTATSAIYVLSGSSTSYANISFENDTSSIFDIGVNPSSHAEADNSFIWNYANQDIRFGTNNTVRAVLSGAGTFQITTVDINGGTVDGITLGTNSAVTEAQIDNININGNTISSTDTDGTIGITPDGSGQIHLNSDTVTFHQDISHSGDTDNKISFGADTQNYLTSGSSRLDISDSGVRLGGANTRVTTVLDEDDMASDSNTSLITQQSLKSFVETEADTILKAGLTWDWGSGTPDIKKSANVSSLTDTATGKVTVNFTSSFADKQYFVGLGVGGNVSDQLRCIETDTRQTGSITITFKYVEDGANVVVNTADTTRDQALIVFTN